MKNIKYSETLLHNKDQSLKDLYKNYSGEGSNKKNGKILIYINVLIDVIN